MISTRPSSYMWVRLALELAHVGVEGNTPQLPGGERVHQRRLVNNLTTRNVDQDGVRFHRGRVPLRCVVSRATAQVRAGATEQQAESLPRAAATPARKRLL